MNNWRRAIAYAFLAVVFLGFCLFVAFNFLISAVPTQLIWGSEGSYLLSTILSEELPQFFRTEICFIIVGMGVGLFMGTHIILKKRRNDTVRILVYIFGPAFLLAFFQNVTFLFLSANYTDLAGLGSTSTESQLGSFFVGTCAPVLFCFVVASLGLGLYIGAHETKN